MNIPSSDGHIQYSSDIHLITFVIEILCQEEDILTKRSGGLVLSKETGGLENKGVNSTVIINVALVGRIFSTK